jgi:predicted esterase
VISAHLTVPRTARYFALGPEAGRVEELWIALHGHSQLAERFARALEPLDDGDTRIIAPEALSRFYLETTSDGRHGKAVGATWLTREDRQTDLEDHLRYLDLLAERLLSELGERPRIVVLGYSQGAVMAARWVSISALVPDRLILWGTPLPEDVTPNALAVRLAGRTVVLVAGDQDPLVAPGVNEAAAAALRALGVNADSQRFAGGHQLRAEALRLAAGR